MNTGLFGFVAMLCLLGLGVPVAYSVGVVAIVGIFYAVGSTFIVYYPVTALRIRKRLQLCRSALVRFDGHFGITSRDHY